MTHKLLREAGAACCSHDLGDQLSPKVIMAGFVYIRLHGPGAAYEGQVCRMAKPYPSVPHG